MENSNGLGIRRAREAVAVNLATSHQQSGEALVAELQSAEAITPVRVLAMKREKADQRET